MNKQEKYLLKWWYSKYLEMKRWYSNLKKVLDGDFPCVTYEIFRLKNGY